MANVQIHELAAVEALDPTDRLVVSTANDNVTRRADLGLLPYQPNRPDSVRRRLDAKLGETVSVLDFGALGDGAADDSPAFQAAVDAHSAIAIPAGRYRLATPVHIRPGRTLVGAGRDTTEIVAEGAHAFVFHRNEEPYTVDTGSATDWNRSAVAGLNIRMSRGGIRAIGHEFRLADVNFAGGSAPDGEADSDGWCVDMVDANECVLAGINAGYGGGTRHAMNANGLRWRAQTTGVNYGDSLVQEVSVKLAAAGTVGILIDGHLVDASKVVNNMVLQRIQVNAPEGGSGITPLAGSTGIKLWNAARICLIDCDVEVLDVAFEEYSEALGGQAGACVANTFISCIAHFCNTNYRDSNALFSRSVIQRNFFGCDNVAPLPTGVVPGDGGRGQDGDAYFQGAWIVNLFGEPSVQFRSRDKDVLLLTGDHKGDAQDDADGHPSQLTPYRGFLFELTSKQAAKLTRPVAFGTADPDDANSTLLDVRLELGNGEGDARGELARVQINDPLAFKPRTTEPVRPVNGMAYYVTSSGALPSTGEWYLGPGLYGRINDGEHPPIAVQQGAVPHRERNTDWTVSATDFGKIHRVNHGSDRLCTIPPGLVPPGEGARRFWVIRQGSGGVSFTVGDGATLRSAGGRDFIQLQYQMVEVVVTDSDDVYLNHIRPDAVESFAQPLHWTNGNLTVPAHYLGKLVRVSNADPAQIEIPAGIVPAGMEAATLKVMKSGPGDVDIVAGTGMTLVSPSGNPSHLITATGKIVEVIITSGSASAQPDHIYIAD